MRIQKLLDIQKKRPNLAGMAKTTAIAALTILALTWMAGCGGSSSTNANAVAVVNVTPTTISMNAGDVVTITPSAVNSQNSSVTTVFTFNSSNTKIATVSPAGGVCAGVWDSIFVVCNGNDASNNPIVGQATVTVTAGGVTSGPISVAVHPTVTSLSVDPAPGGCFSTNQTFQFTAHAFHNGTDITPLVGNITWNETNPTVGSADANGLVTAHQGGITQIVASVGTTTSPAQSFRSCMPVRIFLRVAGIADESAVMNVGDTKPLELDTIDENGVVTTAIPTFPLTINNPLVATVVGDTLTAVAPGGTGIFGACSPPICGVGLNTPIYSNLFGVVVGGTSSNTSTIYAASSFPPPSGTASTLIPIDGSKSPPSVGTAISLPGRPNSIVFDRLGSRAFIGTSAGLAVLTAGGNTVTTVSGVPVGKVLAVSANGTQAIISNAANDPSTGAPIDPNPAEQRLWVFDDNSSTLTTFIVPGIVAASFDDDGFKVFAVGHGSTANPTPNPNVTVFSTQLSLVNQTIAGTNTDVATVSSGPFVYVANSQGLQSIATCNNVQQSLTPPVNDPGSIRLVGSVLNQNQIVAVEATGLDVENVFTTFLIPPIPITAANCQEGVAYSNRFINFGVGAFTPRQLVLASNGSHFAVLPVGLNKVLTTAPDGTVKNVNLAAGGTEPFTGGMTLDGGFLWVGVGGSNTVNRINLNTGADEVQVPTSFKKADGSAAPPDLVAVQPK